MFKIRSILSLFFALIFYPTSLNATLIGFEDLAEGAIVSDQYAHLGVVFDGMKQILTVPNYSYFYYPPHSGSSVIGGQSSDQVTVTFAKAVQNVSVYGSIGYNGFIGNDPRYLTLTATAFDDTGTAVATATITGAAPKDTLIALQAPEIRSVTFSQRMNFFALDDLSFDTISVPEISSWAMFICGFGLLGAMMRRRPARAFAFVS